MDALNKRCIILLLALAFVVLTASSRSEVGNKTLGSNPFMNDSQENGIGNLSNPEFRQMAGFLTPGEAYSMIQNGSVVIDVRTPDEYKQGHIEDAINIDCYSENFLVRLESLNRNSTYIVYCRTGYRSGIALEAMKALGFKEAYNIAGGIERWSGEGYPLVFGPPSEQLQDSLKNI